MFESLSLESVVRLSAFTVMAIILASWEWLFPRRRNSRKLLRWPGNFGVFMLNVIMLTLIPLSAVGAAIISIQYKFGLFYWVEVTFWPKVVFSILFLDLVIYWQHRIFHMIPLMWRIHRMHHTDIDIDFTTALRFHPIEIFISILIKAVAIIAIGAPVFAVIAFEVILNSSAMFNHSNVAMPRLIDKMIRLFIVTPDMHRIHHSTNYQEHSMNYGFALSLWDRLFSSYRDQPAGQHPTMEIGLSIFNQDKEARLDKLITQPFRSQRTQTN